MAEQTSGGILSQGTWNVSGQVLDMRNGELLLLGVLQSDKSDKEVDGLDGGKLHSSSDGLDSGVGHGRLWRSRMTTSVSKSKKSLSMII